MRLPSLSRAGLGPHFSRAHSPPEPDAFYAATVELAARCCRTSGAAILLMDDERLTCKAQWNMSDLADPVPLEVDKFCRRVVWRRQPIVDDDDAPGAFWAGAPIVLPDSSSCVGVLVVADEFPDVDYPSEVRRILELLASQVAQSMSADLRIDEEWQRMNLFIAKVTHELRTPLNGILGCTALLRGQLGGAEADAAETLRLITASAEHNLQTVNQILDFAKLDAGRVELERLPFDLRECVEEAMAMLPVDRKPWDVELGYEMAEDAEVVGDPHRLKQVLLNLLSNALKFTTCGSVVLSVQLTTADDSGHGVHFTVRDTGAGLAPEAAQTLFQPYSQGSASVTRTHGGTGLGLAISRMLAEAMGGRLWLESTVGEGSAFHFTAAVPLRPTPARGFPGGSVLLVDDRPARASLLQRHLESLRLKVHRAPVLGSPELPPHCDVVLVAGSPPSLLPAWPVPWALVADGPPPSHWGAAPPAFVLPAVVSQRRLRRQLEALWASRHPTLVPTPPRSTPPSPPLTPWESSRELAGLRVLVVDDVKVNRMVLQGFLRRLECHGDVCSNGAEAVEAAAARSYDVAILDLQMPVMDGLDAARLVRALPQTPYLVAASATPGELVHSQVCDAGFDAFLQKPIRFEELCHVLVDSKRTQCPSLCPSSCPGNLDPLASDIRSARSPKLAPPTCIFSNYLSDADGAAPHDAGPATPRAVTRRASTHLKVLSSLRTTVGLAPKAPGPTPAKAAAPQKSPAPPHSPSYKRPSRLFNIVSPAPALSL
eukprot:EG_transcript_1017